MTIVATVRDEPVSGCVAITITREVKAAGKRVPVHAEPSDAAGIAWRWTGPDVPLAPLLRCPAEVLDAIVAARVAQAGVRS